MRSAMLRLYAAAAALACALPAPAAAQPHAFLPLQVGNEWTYEVSAEDTRVGISRVVVVSETPVGGEAGRALRCEQMAPDGTVLTATDAAIALPGFDVASPAPPVGCERFVFGPGVPDPNALDAQYDQAVSVGGSSVVADSVFQFSVGWSDGSHGSGSMGWAYASGIGLLSHRDTNCYDTCASRHTRLVHAKVDGVEYGSLSATIEPEPVAQGLRAYPSPASTQVQIETWATRVFIYDLLGRRVAEAEAVAGAPVRLDVSAWPVGLYVARSAEAGEVRTVRFIVAR